MDKNTLVQIAAGAWVVPSSVGSVTTKTLTQHGQHTRITVVHSFAGGELYRHETTLPEPQHADKEGEILLAIAAASHDNIVNILRGHPLRNPYAEHGLDTPQSFQELGR
ncbi:hypothetical protein CAI21_21920 [Alkalilimnicola ehrlichii]|uniref:Uncharacterized protein n=1 Tax=Alkalilimnicola ehrlichii TaxID=351052 RepID=A0A3E0WFB1_9GAMM|nr:hypothetical protein [Alkalilimnicola ehrlichii]RFA24368.1 hypothetical protein CAI21_21920 [Alkalilimnicola ehrlichii]RFA31622.1 hypothetical protein CAL65_22005 [Alkalilimnicola ehrlichii]